MSVRIKLKNSVVKDKAPVPADLEIGEVAINAHVDSPSAYIKDSSGAIVKLAGKGAIGGTAATETVAGIAELATQAETDAGTDDQRIVTPLKLRTAVGTLVPAATDTQAGKVELATATETTTGTDATRAVTPAGLKAALAAQAGSGTAPATPTSGTVWVDSSVSPSVIKVYDGTNWIVQTGATATGATAPTTPAAGQIWIDTSASPSVTKIWDGTVWIAAAPDGSAAAAIANDAKYATKAELKAEDLWDRTGPRPPAIWSPQQLCQAPPRLLKAPFNWPMPLPSRRALRVWWWMLPS
jgi:hypothetical protein